MKNDNKWRYSSLLSIALTSLLLFMSPSRVQAQMDVEDTPASPVTTVTEIKEEISEEAIGSNLVADESVDEDEEKDSVDSPSPEPKTEEIAFPLVTETSEMETIEEISAVTSEAEEATSHPTISPMPDVTLDEQTFYMTEQNHVTVVAEVGDALADEFVWTFADQPIENLQQWNYQTGQFDNGRPLITLEQAVVHDGVLTAEFLFDYPFTESAYPQGTPKLDQRYDKGGNLRLTYPNYIGQYQLIGTHKSGQMITQPIHYRPYKYFLDYEEIVQKTDQITKQAQQNNKRYVSLKEYGQSVEGRPLRYGIIADSEASVKYYLEEFHPQMLNQPSQLIDRIQKDPDFDYRIPVMIHNTHADENPGPEIVVGLYEKLALEDTIQLTTQNAQGKKYEVSLHVPELLNRLIFLFTFVESPDSRAYNLREHPSTGLDLNRDHGYQVLPEVKAMVRLINEWDPLSFFDLHGFVDPMLIEPTNPPHDPNFEADLIYPYALKQAYAIGRAAQANTGYDFQIPYENWRKFQENPDDPSLKYTENVGWDDAFSGYTGVYALYHGIFGHTVEVPEANDRSYIAGLSGILGSIDFTARHIDELVTAKLTIFDRGINKVEAEETEQYFVGADNQVKGRPRKHGQNFFPDYYIIPMNPATQNNPQAAFEMIEYFVRNGIKINQLTQDMGGFHTGDLIINMGQAKRGFVNHVLYLGSNESEFPAMYAELVVNFPAMRGFDSYPIYNENDKDLFAHVLGEVTHTQAPQNNPGLAPYYYVKNNGSYVTMAINEALSQGSDIYLAEDGFYMDQDTYDELSGRYPLIAQGIFERPVGEAIKPLKIYGQLAASYDDRYPSNAKLALLEMGFELVETIEEADLLVLDQYVTIEMLGQKPAIIIGGWTGQDLAKLIPELKVKNNSNREGLLKAVYDKNSSFNSGFNNVDFFYTREGAWIEEIPEGFKVIAKIANTDDFYLAGWWPGFEEAKGKVIAIAGEFMGQPLYYLAGSPTNKMHTKSFYRLVANGIFNRVGQVQISGLEEIKKEIIPALTPVLSDQEVADCVIVRAEEKQVTQKYSKSLPQTGLKDHPWLIVTSLGLITTGMACAYFGKRETA